MFYPSTLTKYQKEKTIEASNEIYIGEDPRWVRLQQDKYQRRQKVICGSHILLPGLNDGENLLGAADNTLQFVLGSL